MLTLNIKKQLASFQLSIDIACANVGVTAILGVSGSGKSTLLNLINGLTQPDNGTIVFNQQTLVNTHKKTLLAPNKRNIATVFQEPLLFPHLRVKQNLIYGMQQDNPTMLDEIIHLLNISHLLDRAPYKLSGGEKQRVAIGRALLSNPQLLLMDEPLSALDMPRKKELLNYIQTLVKEINIPVIYVTHNINEARQIADNVLVLEQGEIIDYGETEEILAHERFLDWL